MGEKMKFYKNIFIVLTYINSIDLIDFINSVHKEVDNYHIIIVNSYYDEKSKLEIENVAQQNKCDFINIPNKGYSFGNNRGIEYALKNYKFDYLIVSNPDIVVKKFDTNNLKNNHIYCGKICNISNKNQNPMLAVENKVSDFLLYKGYLNKNKFLIFLGLGINRILKEIFMFLFKLKKSKQMYIYQPHGSFIIFSNYALKILENVFDENIFLFGEEGILAKRAKKKNVKVIYTEQIICIHKEDGSMKLTDRNLNSDIRNSNIYYYENYCKE